MQTRSPVYGQLMELSWKVDESPVISSCRSYPRQMNIPCRNSVKRHEIKFCKAVSFRIRVFITLIKWVNLNSSKGLSLVWNVRPTRSINSNLNTRVISKSPNPAFKKCLCICSVKLETSQADWVKKSDAGFGFTLCQNCCQLCWPKV